MKRTGLKHFLVHSVIVHALLIAALAVYFLSGDRTEIGESYLIGLTDGVEIQALSPAHPPRSPGEPATKEDITTAAGNERSEKAESLKPEEKPEKINKVPEIKNEVAETPPERMKTEAAPSEAENQTAKRETAQSKTVKSAMPAGEGHPPAELSLERGETSGEEVASTGQQQVDILKSSAMPAYDVNPKPPYPTSARRRGYEGEVKLRVLVLENGTVGEIKLEKPSGYEILDDTALDTVRKWKFKPATENGREVSSWVTVPIKFRLDKG